MKAMLEFSLPEEDIEFNNAMKGTSCMCALEEMNNKMFRQRLKHGDPNTEFKTPAEAVEKLWEEFREEINNHDIIL